MNTHHIPQAPADQQPALRTLATAKQRGFTLVELMIVLTIVGILLSITVPSMAAIVDSVKLSSTTNMFMSSMRLARSESTRRGVRVAMCKSYDGTSCSVSGGWEQGWIVFQDLNGNGDLDANEKVIERVDGLASSLRFTGNQNVARYIAYNAGGTARTATGAMLAGTLTLCHVSASTAEGRLIVISSGGRARVQQVPVGQCA